ncbi:MAG: acyltransferase, partial [Aquincola sp.]|nr:acyltransferase [Aquincola sp.]
RLGDYSYGVYIYAFPVQQAVTALQPQIGLGTHIAVSTLFTLVLAVLSWHAVEKPALAAARRWRSRRRAGTGTPSSPMAGTAAG